jgi:hypothetical protein
MPTRGKQLRLQYCHWERGDPEPRAAFRFTVPAQKSHFSVSYGCIAKEASDHSDAKQAKASGFAQYRLVMDGHPDCRILRAVCFQADNRASLWR